MIAVVGGGWFGCHIANCLQGRGADFVLFEKMPRLFDGASGFNQNRLHLGFHYPRSAETRLQSRIGYEIFLKEYPSLSSPIENNLYAVCQSRSLLDFKTYELIMKNSDLEFEVVDGSRYGLTNIGGCIRCKERVINTNQARDYFTQILGDKVQLGQAFDFDKSEEFDFVINCTYQSDKPHFSFDIQYEPCVVLLYSSSEKLAITLMDGPFYSIYPFQDNLFTLYSVQHSRLAKHLTARQAYGHLNSVNKKLVEDLKGTMEYELRKYYPNFNELFTYEGFHRSIRSCSTDTCDARVCYVEQENNIIQVMSGKIDSIFHAEELVAKCLGY